MDISMQNKRPVNKGQVFRLKHCKIRDAEALCLNEPPNQVIHLTQFIKSLKGFVGFYRVLFIQSITYDLSRSMSEYCFDHAVFSFAST